MTVDRPLRVHLDSSDYSRLSDIRGDAVWQLRTLHILESAIAEKKIEVFLSASLVAEASPNSRMSLTDGLHRLAVIDRLCKGTSLRFVGDLITEEMSHGPARPYAVDGNWAPRISLESKVKEIKSHLLEVIQSAGRTARRSSLTKDGHLKNARQLLLSPSMQKEFAEKLPVAAGALPSLAGFLEGRQTATRVAAHMLAGMNDLDAYAKTFAVDFDGAVKLVAWVRRHGEAYVDRIYAMRQQALKLQDATPRQDFDKTIDELLAATVTDAANRALEERALENGICVSTFSNQEDVRARASTTFSLFAAIVAVMRKKAIEQRYPIKPENSDVGDIYHAAYLPHVDWFRCDNRSALCWASLAADFETTLFPDLDSLIQRLETL